MRGLGKTLQPAGHILEHLLLALYRTPVPFAVPLFVRIDIHPLKVHIGVLSFDFHESLDIHLPQMLVHVHRLDHRFKIDMRQFAV